MFRVGKILKGTLFHKKNRIYKEKIEKNLVDSYY